MSQGRSSKEGRKDLVVDLEACMLCKACVEACGFDAIKVEGDTTRFLFDFETDGSLTAKQTLVKALELLEIKFEEFREGISALESA